MVDVFEQVEEELRSDRYTRLARTWLPVVGGVLLVALIAALGWWGWTSWQTSKSEKASVVYERGLEALQKNDKSAADAAFAEVERTGNGAYKTLALHERAGIAQASGQRADAAALFDRAAASTRDPILHDAAVLKAAWLRMDLNTPLADQEKALEPLTKEGRPYRAFAQEALAMARLQAGQTAQARSLFVLISFGQEASDETRARAQAAIDAIDTGTAASLKDIVKQQALIPPAAAPSPEALAAQAAQAQPQQAQAPQAQ